MRPARWVVVGVRSCVCAVEKQLWRFPAFEKGHQEGRDASLFVQVCHCHLPTRPLTSLTAASLKARALFSYAPPVRKSSKPAPRQHSGRRCVRCVCACLLADLLAWHPRVVLFRSIAGRPARRTAGRRRHCCQAEREARCAVSRKPLCVPAVLSFFFVTTAAASAQKPAAAAATGTKPG